MPSFKETIPQADDDHSATGAGQGHQELSPQLLVWSYTRGIFPMADGRQGAIAWYSPDPRAILPLDGFHIPHGLRRMMRKTPYRITTDRAFTQVIASCAKPSPGRQETWINPAIERAYTALHRLGLAHSIEAWRIDASSGKSELVGGLYGVALGGAFFGESMFSTATDASKICLVHLVQLLRAHHWRLLDVQFVNPHLLQFGVIEIPRREYLKHLAEALAQSAVWPEDVIDVRPS